MRSTDVLSKLAVHIACASVYNWEANIDCTVQQLSNNDTIHVRIGPLNDAFMMLRGRLPLGCMFPRTNGVRKEELWRRQRQ